MAYSPGDIVYVGFTVQTPSTGQATDADSTPTGKVNRNGSDDLAVTVTVTQQDTGRYVASFTIPSGWSNDDSVLLFVTAIVSGVSGKAEIAAFKLGSDVPTALENAAAVWTTTLLGTAYAHGEAGYLLDAQISGISGGSGGDATLDNQETIISMLQSGNLKVTVLSPRLSRGTLELIAGDAYLRANNRSIPFFGKGLWSDLTGSTIYLDIFDTSDDENLLLRKAGTIVVPTGSTQEVYIELLTPENVLVPGTYRYGVWADWTVGTITESLEIGTCVVSRARGQ